MSDEQKDEPKKGFPGNILVLLVLAIFATMLVQQFFGGKTAKVAFNYEVEHLVNLDLIVPSESRKTAGSDQLVTFSGRFRDVLTEESKQRFKYLSNLHENRQILEEKADRESELALLQKRVREAGELYLAISGQEIPREGYTVIGRTFNTPERESQIILREPGDLQGPSFPELQDRLKGLEGSQSTESLQQFSEDLSQFLAQVRSPVLGIGNEALKKTLRRVAGELQMVSEGELTPSATYSAFDRALKDFDFILRTLADDSEGGVLKELRSVHYGRPRCCGRTVPLWD